MWPFKRRKSEAEYEAHLTREFGPRNQAGDAKTPPHPLYLARRVFASSVASSDMNGLMELYAVLNGVMSQDDVRGIVEMGQERILKSLDSPGATQ